MPYHQSLHHCCQATISGLESAVDLLLSPADGSLAVWPKIQPCKNVACLCTLKALEARCGSGYAGLELYGQAVSFKPPGMLAEAQSLTALPFRGIMMPRGLQCQSAAFPKQRLSQLHVGQSRFLSAGLPWPWLSWAQCEFGQTAVIITGKPCILSMSALFSSTQLAF